MAASSKIREILTRLSAALLLYFLVAWPIKEHDSRAARCSLMSLSVVEVFAVLQEPMPGTLQAGLHLTILEGSGMKPRPYLQQGMNHRDCLRKPGSLFTTLLRPSQKPAASSTRLQFSCISSLAFLAQWCRQVQAGLPSSDHIQTSMVQSTQLVELLCYTNAERGLMNPLYPTRWHCS